MASCYQQGCILSEGHECLHMSAEEATAGELRHQLAERDKRIAKLVSDLRQEELVSDRLRLSWREDVATERQRADLAEARAQKAESTAQAEAEHHRNELLRLEKAHSALQARVKELEADAMIAHRWFAARFGDEMNGRDFAVKCAMASRALYEDTSLLAAVITAAEPIIAWPHGGEPKLPASLATLAAAVAKAREGRT